MKSYPGALAFTAQIYDVDSEALIFPDFETELVTSVERGEISIDAIFCCNYDRKNSYINLDLSADPWIQRLAAKIRTQALEDEDFLARAYDNAEQCYGLDSYIRQNKRRKDELI